MKFKLSEAISILERSPRVFRALLQNLPHQWIHADEGDNSWSPFDVLGHLIHGEKTDWMVRTSSMLEHNSKITFDPFDRFAQFKNSQGKSMETLLTEFTALREANVEEQRSKQISPEDLERKAEHPELGTVTLSHLLSAWVVHDLGHIAQVSRVLAKQYKKEVGPWPKYLTILNYTPKE